VANLCCAGLVTRRVTFEVSTHVSSSAKLAWRNDHQKKPMPSFDLKTGIARKDCAIADKAT